MFYLGLLAGSQRVPFLPTRAGLGSDVLVINPDMRTVRSPYGDGEELVAMPALAARRRVRALNRADWHGNGQFLGPDPFFDELFLGAAGRRYVTAEKVVEPGGLPTRARCRGHRQPPAHRRRGRGSPAVPTSRRAPPTTGATRLPEALRRPPPTPMRGRRSTPVPARRRRRLPGAVSEAGAADDAERGRLDVTRAEVCAVACAEAGAATAR